MSEYPPGKKPRLDEDIDRESIRQRRSTFLSSLTRSVTPPPRKSATPGVDFVATDPEPASSKDSAPNPVSSKPENVRSPFQLTRIQDLPSKHNVDTIRLSDLLGDPMIKECWQFNYLFDVDWLMSYFDNDVRDLVQVKIVHGSWKREAPNRIGIEAACQRRQNVKPITAYLPDPFGTHHSKMMILIRHDDLAQVIIHTANMIPQDWTNMCQAVWKSPLLPLIAEAKEDEHDSATPGSGTRFKTDLLAYLNAYRDQRGTPKLGGLTKQLQLYDFSSIRAALVASVPSKINFKSRAANQPLWGWPSLKRVLRHVPCSKNDEGTNPSPHIVLQVSSIATLGKDDKYLRDTIFSTLSTVGSPETEPVSNKGRVPEPKYSIIFPTASTIRESLDGYSAGASIHMKVQSVAQQSQLQYLRRYLCHWSPPSTQLSAPNSSSVAITGSALRIRAAPHIKTYIRFTNSERMDQIDWAMVTSANLSTQAWGTAASANGEVKVQSYEIGVLVWPDLFSSTTEKSNNNVIDASDKLNQKYMSQVKMVPTFGTDLPGPQSSISAPSPTLSADQISATNPVPVDIATTLVGLRLPYDLPLMKYSHDDLPWCATMNHLEPDWRGGIWTLHNE